MKPSLQCFSFFLVLSFLFSCNGEGFRLNCDGDDRAAQQAVRDGDLEELKRLVDTGRVNINAHCEEHDTALMEIFNNPRPRERNDATVKYLIENAGVDITITNHYGNTLLQMAAGHGYTDTVRLLLRRGADVDSKGINGVTPLMVAYDEEIAFLLIENGADVNHKNDKNVTPLHNAAKYNFIDLVSFLIRNGADVHSKDNEGQTPLHWAACPGLMPRSSTSEIVCLLENNAAINSQDNNGDTPLHRASFWPSKNAAATLLAWGADVNIRNNKGHKPLDPAHSRLSLEETFLAVAEAGRTELAEEILDNSHVDINTKDDEHFYDSGDTALIIAARHGHITLVEKLIERRANLNLKNDEGQTALMVAIEAGHEAVALALIAERVRGRINLNLKDNKGWSALKYARKGKGKNTQIAKALLKNGAEEYDLIKIAKKGAKSLFRKAAEKAPEAALAL